MNGRKVHYINVSKMTERELCSLLKIPYVPFYKSAVWWGMIILLVLPMISSLL